MTKYICEGCPAFIKNSYQCSIGILRHNNVDCTIKKIVDICKDAVKFCKECKPQAEPKYDCIDCTEKGMAMLANKILDVNYSLIEDKDLAIKYIKATLDYMRNLDKGCKYLAEKFNIEL
jgi:hypothetical protein